VSAVRHIVRRFNWKRVSGGLLRAPGEHRVAWFDTDEVAFAECRRRELAVRGRVNPFRCGPTFPSLTTFPMPVFLDWLGDEGIESPEESYRLADWIAWWDLEAAALSTAQRERVWEGLNRVRFHDVIQRRSDQVAYAVLRIMWNYLDDFNEPGEEGGRIETVYRTRAKAEAECTRLNVEGQREWGSAPYFYVERWDDDLWPTAERRLGRAVADATFFEVVEIDIGGVS
jgi:hypothetical protein